MNERDRDRQRLSQQPKLLDMQEMNIRSYASEPDRGRRNWKEKAEAKQYMPIVEDAGEKRGRRLVRARGELIERTFAHAYETGAMRRTHLRHHNNILKRLLVHIAGFNLALTMRKLYGVGKPRRLQGLFLSIWGWIGLMLIGLGWHRRDPNDSKTNFATRTGLLLAARANKSKMGFATGC